jgi:hypothetical protein
MTGGVEITPNFEDRNMDSLETSMTAALDAIQRIKKLSSRFNKENITSKVLNKIMTAAHTCNHFSSEIYATPIFLLIPVIDKDNRYSQLAIIEEVKGRPLYFLTTSQIEMGIDSYLKKYWIETGMEGKLSKETHINISDGALKARPLKSVNQLPEHFSLQGLNNTLHASDFPNVSINLPGDDKTPLPG